MFSDFLLAISCIALAVAVILLERRVSALEKSFIPEITVDDLKRLRQLSDDEAFQFEIGKRA